MTFRQQGGQQGEQQGERRQWPRFTLRIFGNYNTCTIALDMVVMVDCSLVDIGRGGVRVRLRPIRKTVPDVAVGQRIDFKEFLSEEFKPLSGLTGTVQWWDPAAREFGVRFDESVDEAALAALADSLPGPDA